MRLCFLLSGGGGNLKFFKTSIESNLIDNIELFAISDRDCPAIEYAKKKNMPAAIIKYTRDYNSELLGYLKKFNPDVIVTNWHKIIDSDVVETYAGKMINLHYSLLPAFPGLIGVEPIANAYIAGCQFVGATTHFVNNETDAGEIISQAVVKRKKDFDCTVNDVFRAGCLILLNSVLIFSGSKKNFRKDDCFYSPSLVFDKHKFNQKFWNVVAGQ